LRSNKPGLHFLDVAGSGFPSFTRSLSAEKGEAFTSSTNLT